MTTMLDELKKKFNRTKCVVSNYTSKGWTPVTLYQFYQQTKEQERVAALYDYWTLGQVFKDFIHNVGYTNSEKLI